MTKTFTLHELRIIAFRFMDTYGYVDMDEYEALFAEIEGRYNNGYCLPTDDYMELRAYAKRFVEDTMYDDV